jgi:hypothetical protein
MVLRRTLGLTALAFAVTLGRAAAQASFTPAYNAPYRAFESHEFGAMLSFPSGGTDFAVEGQYRFGHGRFDIGVKVGVADGVADAEGVAGVEARFRVIDHTEQNFPLDGAVVLGIGTYGFDRWAVPSAGVSLGRRVDLDGFEFVAYGQPTVFLTTGNPGAAGGAETRFDFGLGLGVDFQIADAVDLRTSFGVADGPGGVSFGVVWVR